MNRYIKAMEIGLANENEGISYFELFNQLEFQLGYEFNTESQITFFYWFLDNFSSRDLDLLKLDELRRDIHFFLANQGNNTIPENKKYLFTSVRAPLSKNWFLNGAAAKQYLDYQELVESRQTAQDAREASKEANEKAAKSIRLAIFAIVVSAAVGLFSIIIDLVAFSKSPVPPYDVNVIEDKSRAAQLEEENAELKEELYKAEMMLEAYESNSTN